MVDTTLKLDGRDLTVQTYQDVEDIIERNKALQNTGPQRGDFRHTASIPLNIILQWLNEEWARGNSAIKLFGPEFDALVARRLKDPDWKWLRAV